MKTLTSLKSLRLILPACALLLTTNIVGAVPSTTQINAGCSIGKCATDQQKACTGEGNLNEVKASLQQAQVAVTIPPTTCTLNTTCTDRPSDGFDITGSIDCTQ